MRNHSIQVKTRGNPLIGWTLLSLLRPREHKYECENQERKLSFNTSVLRKSWCGTRDKTVPYGVLKTALKTVGEEAVIIKEDE